MLEKQRTMKAIYTVALRILIPMMKTKLFESQLPG